MPDSLRWQFQRLAYFPFTQMKYLARYGCTIDEYYGIADFQDRDEVKDHAARISHAVLVLKNDFWRIDMEPSWTSYKVKSAIRAVKAKAVRPGDVEEPLGTAASSAEQLEETRRMALKAKKKAKRKRKKDKKKEMCKAEEEEKAKAKEVKSVFNLVQVDSSVTTQ